MESLIVLLVLALFTWACGYEAKKKNRSVGGWAVLGFFFGIFAFIVILILDPKEE